ncbi:MAG: RNA 2',3'-cyclic phosphodiesterase [Bacteroidetes bacterium]|nr:RNA 2',3'-cyclic phosphodiesterase [Bacteroidota bacterium]
MKQSLPSEFSRYFIAVLPPSPVYEEIFSMKNYFREKYNSKASLNSPPHITLHMPFLWKEKKENDLVNSLDVFAKGKEQFNIELLGFGAFPPQVIFISVKENEQLNQLQYQFQKFCKTELNLFNAQYKDQPFHPHVTLAFRDLKKPMFVSAWNEFKEKSFSSSFVLEKITLLKHNGKHWQSFHHSHF